MIDELSKVLISLISVGSIARIILNLIRLQSAEDEAASYKKRTRNTIVFLIISVSIYEIKNVVDYYY